VADVRIDFLANISQATGEIAKLGKSVDSQVKTMNASFATLGRTFLGVAAAFGVGFSLKAAIDEASRAEDALNNFNIVLKQTGIFSKQTSAGFVEFADTLERTTNIASEDILDLAGKIQTLTGVSARQLATLTTVTLDFAKANNLSFEQAGALVSKAVNGQVEAFKRYGIVLKDAGSQAANFNNVVQALGRFQGTAEERAKSFSSTLAGLRIQFGNILEEIGNLIIKNPLVIESLEGVKQSFVDLAAFVRNNQEVLGELVSFSVVFVISAFEALGEAVSGSVAIFKLGQLAYAEYSLFVISATQKVAAALAKFTGKDFFKDFADSLTENIKNINREIRTLTGELEKLTRSGEKISDKPIKVSFDSSGLSGTGGRGAVGGDSAAAKTRSKELLEEQKERDRLIKEETKAQEQRQKTLFGNVQTLVSNLGQGAQGVTNSLASIASTFGDTIIPGLGGAASALFQFLAQGPEAVRAQIQAFIDNIPLIIDNVVKSIPAVIEVLAANMPKVALSLANQMPTIATKLAIELIAQLPNIAKSFVDSLISEAGRLISSIADGVKEAISRAVGFGGGGGGGIGGILGGILGGPGGAITGALGGIGKKFGFAEGGIVPGGAPFVDRVPAMLTPQERVLNRGEVANLDRMNEVLEQIARGGGATGGATQLTVNLLVGEEQLAQAVLNLDRQGFRKGVA
jgi:hypothetical protein